MGVLVPLLLTSTQGCSIGVKEKFSIVYVTYNPDPDVKGAIRVATNKKIPVTIVGKEDVFTEIDIGGYYVIHKNDLKALVEAAAKVSPGR